MQDLIGLGQAKLVVSKLLSADSGVQSLLFSGPEGCGKTKLAEKYIQACLCKAAEANGACGDCSACRAFINDSAVDFLRIKPQSSGLIIKLESIVSGKSNSEVYSLQDFLRIPPLQAKCRVVLIEDADRMNNEASHALLKTLEEPNHFAKIVLITSHRSEMLPTILSRCLNITCELPDREELNLHFGQLTREEVIFGDGAPGLINRIRSHALIYSQLYQLLESFVSLPTYGALKAAEDFRNTAAKFEKELDLNPRLALCEGLRCFALWSSRSQSSQPWQTQKIANAYKRVFMNANASFLCDDLFAAILSR